MAELTEELPENSRAEVKKGAKKFTRKKIIISLVIFLVIFSAYKRFFGTGSDYSINKAKTVSESAYGEMRAGNNEKAIELFQGAKELDPSNTEYRSAIAMLYNRTGKKDEALKEYDGVLQINPSHPDANYSTGVILMEKGDTDEPVEYLSKAVQANPDFVAAIDKLGDAYHAQNKFDEAIEQWNLATTKVSLQSKYGAVYKAKVARTYEKMGKKDLAKAEWRNVLSIDPDNQEARNNL